MCGEQILRQHPTLGWVPNICSTYRMGGWFRAALSGGVEPPMGGHKLQHQGLSVSGEETESVFSSFPKSLILASPHCPHLGFVPPTTTPVYIGHPSVGAHRQTRTPNPSFC